MKVLLVFPPQWTPFRPYLSLPSLAAYLQEHGVSVIQKDFNLEAYDLLLSNGYLRKTGEQLNSQFAALELKETLTPGIEQKLYSDLFMAKSLVPELVQKVEEAKAVYRDPINFYDPDKLASATHIITESLTAIGLAHYPTVMGLSSFEMPSFMGSFDSLKQATVNRLENPYIELYEQHLLPFIADKNPDLIGITISGESQLIPGLTLSRLLKSQGIKAHIAVGGYVVSMLDEILIKYPELFDEFFDSAIINDGEKPLLELARCLEQGKNLDGVPNLIFRDITGIRMNPKETPENINALPTPTFEGLPLHNYFSPDPVLPVLSSRGCYWAKCAFCTHSLAYGLTYQVKDASKFVDDIEELSKRYGVTHIALSDEGTSPSSISKISDEILRRGLKVRLSTSIRPEKQFTPELCQKMASAGLREVYIGVESSCDRVLGRINKGTTCAINEEILGNIHGAGIWDHVYIMFGFPGETMNEAYETFDFLKRNTNIIRSLGISNFSVGRNSRVMKHPEEYGVTLPQAGNDLDFKLYIPYQTSEGLSDQEGWQLTEDCYAKVAVKLEGDVLLEKIGHHYDKGCILPQYLSHYEATDPFLGNIVRVKAPKAKLHRTLTSKSRPVLKHGVKIEQLKFNLRHIRKNITDNAKLVVYPESTITLFDPEHNRFKRIAEQAAEILSLCDGQNTLTQISRKLALKFSVPAAVIERDAAALIQPLYDEGYLNLSSESAPAISKH
jgi:anaerobic magnesium-protoporphyrin IX monomethyl ester cyclase